MGYTHITLVRYEKKISLTKYCSTNVMVRKDIDECMTFVQIYEEKLCKFYLIVSFGLSTVLPFWTAFLMVIVCSSRLKESMTPW